MPDHIPGKPKHPLLAMATICLGAWLFMLSGGIANIALPRLSAELGVPEADIVWVAVAFQIAAVSTTIPLAGLAEAIGIRRVYIGGLVVYVLGSMACGFSTDFVQLTLARVLQGLGAAGMSSVNAALVRQIVPARMLGRGISTLAMVVGAAQGAAPIIGSAILEVAHWRWLFFYDLPLVAVTIALALHAIPPDRTVGHHFDITSAVLCVPALGLCFFGLDRLAWDPVNPVAYAILGLGLATLALLVRRETRRDRPLFPTDLFRLPSFALPAMTSVAMYGAQGLALTALPFVLVDRLALSLIEAGILISLCPLATLLASPVVGALTDRFPRVAFSAFGGLVAAGGFGLCLLAARGHLHWLMMAGIIAIGLGFALFQNHNAKSLILAAPARRVGAAGGVQSTMRVVGQMTGPALVGISFHTFGAAGALAAMGAGIGLTLLGAGLGFRYMSLDRA